MNKVSVFNNIKSVNALGKVDIEHCLTAIEKGGKHTSNVLKVRDGENVKDKIPVVTWNGVFTKRSNNNVVSFSDHIYCDFDNTNDKDTLSKIDCVVAAWTSVSGKGLGCIVKSKGINKSNFKSTVSSLIQYFEERNLYPDKLTDIARCNVLSYDPDMYYNPNAEVFDVVEPVIVEQHHYSNLLDDGCNNTACNISLAYTYKKGLFFVEGQRHNFTVTYFGLCNMFGVPLEYAYGYALENGCVSPSTYKKAVKIYNHYNNQHGIKIVDINGTKN